MPSREEIRATAARMLGRTVAIGAFREYKLLERLLGADEPIEAMVLGRLRGAGPVGSQRLLVVTPGRVLLVEKGLLTGRERVRDVPRSSIVRERTPSSMELVLELAGGEEIDLHLAQPSEQVARAADLIRLGPGGEGTPTPEVLDLVKQRIGRFVGAGYEAHAMALASSLEADESLLDVAIATIGDRDGLLAAATGRLLFVPSTGKIGAGEPDSWPYAAFDFGGLRGTSLVLTLGDRDLTFALGPPSRVEPFATRVVARVPH